MKKKDLIELGLIKTFQKNYHRYPIESLKAALQKYPEYFESVDYIAGFLPKERFADPMIEAIRFKKILQMLLILK